MKRVIADADPGSYQPHRLHGSERRWPETNCYVDLLIEIMHATGYDPVAALGFTVTQDFEGDQFTFFKFPLGDLRRLAGLDVQELAIFDRLDNHVVVQIARGRMVLVEVDAYYLPDTRGITYRLGHAKTTIGINALDVAARRMEYFHNAGLFALAGEDYDALFDPPATGNGLPLFPYTEFVKLNPAERAGDQVGAARDILRRHLRQRPAHNPFLAYGDAFAGHVQDLATRRPEYFHTYAFNNLRQVGANFELLADHLDWLASHGVAGLGAASQAALRIADAAKAMQFKLARAMARQRFDGLADTITQMGTDYDAIMQVLDGV